MCGVVVDFQKSVRVFFKSLNFKQDKVSKNNDRTNFVPYRFLALLLKCFGFKVLILFGFCSGFGVWLMFV